MIFYEFAHSSNAHILYCTFNQITSLLLNRHHDGLIRSKILIINMSKFADVISIIWRFGIKEGIGRVINFFSNELALIKCALSSKNRNNFIDFGLYIIYFRIRLPGIYPIFCSLIIMQIDIFISVQHITLVQYFRKIPMSLKIAFIILASIFLAINTEKPLLKLSENNHCLKNIIDEFITENDCHQISQKEKSQLSISMTNCLLKQMNKNIIVCEDPINCEIRGDAWNTFTIFFTHIDNLCHYYREILWQERAQNLVSSLSSSAKQSNLLIKQNVKDTAQIMKLQNDLKIQLAQSILGQKMMFQLLGNSSKKLFNMTGQLEIFLDKINGDIDKHYSSLRGILEAISSAMDNVSLLQNVMKSQVDTLNGLIYFMFLFFCVIAIGSFPKFREYRNICLIIIASSFLLQLFGYYYIQIIGTKVFRCLVLTIITIILYNSKSEQNRLEQLIDKKFGTARIQRLIRKVSTRIQKDTEQYDKNKY